MNFRKQPDLSLRSGGISRLGQCSKDHQVPSGRAAPEGLASGSGNASVTRAQHAARTDQKAGSMPSTPRFRRMAVGVTALTTALTTAGFAGGLAQASPGGNPVGTSTPDLGPNTVLFDPSMSTASIQTRVDEIFAQQDTN